jgi:hypothetical protein
MMIMMMKIETGTMTKNVIIKVLFTVPKHSSRQRQQCK